MKKTWLSIAVLLLTLVTSPWAFGQAGADSSKGSVSVSVLDSSGGVVPNATVTLSGPTGSRSVTTDSRGEAVFFGVIPETYTAKVEFKGFRATEIKNIVVRPNERSSLRAELQPGAVTEVVQVSENAARVDTTTTTVGSNISQDLYQNLPIARNITALFSLAPGVASGGGTGSANPSISGSSGLENLYIIDGINTTDTGYGAFGVWSNVYGSLGTGVNFDFVKEVQIKTGGFEAQYGQALGGVVNVVTKSGGNEFHGSIYAYTNPYWSEATYKQPNDSPRTSNPLTEIRGRHAFDFGVDVGGPLIKDKLFWYAAFNPSFSSLSRLGPVNFGTRTLGAQVWDTRNFNWTGKLNWDATAKHRFEGTAFGDPSRDPAGVHRSLVRDDLDSTSRNEYGTRNWAVKYNGVFTAKTLFQASFGWNHTYFTETPANNLYSVRDYTKPKANSAYTNVGGVGFLENNQGNNKQTNLTMTQLANFWGGHQFDLGYGFSSVDYAAIRLYSGPNWALPTANGIAASDVGKSVNGGFFYFYPTRTVGGVSRTNVYRQVRGNFSDPSVGTTTDYHSAYLQDAWQINKYITAKLGIRWEQQNIAGNFSGYTFAANWSPRLGVIVDPTGSRKTKLYANWGRFFEKIPQDLAVRAQSEEAGYLNGYFFGLPPTQANLVPGTVFSPTGTHPTIIAGGTKAQYQEEVVAGVEREFKGGWVVTGRFIHRSLKRMLEDISGITVEQALAGSGQEYVIANPSISMDIFNNATPCTSGPNCDTDSGYTRNSGLLGKDGKADGFPDGRRVYKAFELTAEKRFATGWSFFANYRLAKLFGNYEGLFRNDNGQSDPNITSLFDFANSPALADQFAVGVLPTDRRHIANFFGSYQFRQRWNFGLGYQVQSGTPISKFIAHPAYANAGELPVGGRGAFGRTAVQNYFDAKIEYVMPLKGDRYKLKFATDMFNLFNRKTLTAVDQNFELDGGIPSNDFLKPLAYHRPFYARFSARLEF